MATTSPAIPMERTLISGGITRLAGLDEAGRGAWAGPLLAAAILVTKDSLRYCRRLGRDVCDSKTLSRKQRERAYAWIAERLPWGVGVVSSREIDQLGMTAANQAAMQRAVRALPVAPAFLLVDGRGFWFSRPHRNIIDGDATVFCIAAASIIAKVTRDRLMREFDRRYPAYGFVRHKGYGTPEHQQMLDHFGPCAIHRQSFRPVRAYIPRHAGALSPERGELVD